MADRIVPGAGQSGPGTPSEVKNSTPKLPRLLKPFCSEGSGSSYYSSPFSDISRKSSDFAEMADRMVDGAGESGPVTTSEIKNSELELSRLSKSTWSQRTYYSSSSHLSETDNNDNQSPPDPDESTLNQSTQYQQEMDGENLFDENGFDPFRMAAAGQPKPWEEWTLKDDFEIGKPLGSGMYGHVYLARTKKEKRIVALKIIHGRQLRETSSEFLVDREIGIHLQLKHKNIIQLFGCFKDDDKVVFVMEYAVGCDVYNDMYNQPEHRYSEEKSASYTYQVADALMYLHSLRIMHRDIKPENLLLGYFGEIKLADFGWSAQPERTGVRSRTTICGTHEYMPPEMISGRPYDEKVDIWCLGVLIYEFLTGNSPFAAECRKDVESRIEAVSIKFPDHVSTLAKDIIKQILCVIPEQRIPLVQIRNHCWVMLNKSKEKPKLIPCFDQFQHLEQKLAEKYREAGRQMALNWMRETNQTSKCISM